MKSKKKKKRLKKSIRNFKSGSHIPHVTNKNTIAKKIERAVDYIKNLNKNDRIEILKHLSLDRFAKIMPEFDKDILIELIINIDLFDIDYHDILYNLMSSSLNDEDDETVYEIMYSYIFEIYPDKTYPIILLSKLNIDKIIYLLQKFSENDVKYSAIENLLNNLSYKVSVNDRKKLKNLRDEDFFKKI